MSPQRKRPQRKRSQRKRSQRKRLTSPLDSPPKKKWCNGYIIYCDFYRKTLVKDYYANLTPQEQLIEAGAMWRFLPNEIKNSFKKFANNERILNGAKKNNDSPYRPPYFNQQVIKQKPFSESELCIIFDDRSPSNGKN